MPSLSCLTTSSVPFVPHQRAWERDLCCCCEGRRGICGWWNGSWENWPSYDFYNGESFYLHDSHPQDYALKTWTHQYTHHAILLSKATSVQVVTEAYLCNEELFIIVHFIFSKHFSSSKTAKLCSCLFCPSKLLWGKNGKINFFLEQGRIRAAECYSYFRRSKTELEGQVLKGTLLNPSQ